MSGLKVVALISGGKDSFFSILHCQANGHEVVALANLHPPLSNGGRSEDIDSYMYQTIGHTVIPLYEQALGLPLYRQEILGAAIDRNKSYATPTAQQETASPTSHDETESIVPLLKKVMAEHPEVNAVSTGAILSDYQRTRVESVAIRLGLVPLSYLWQYPFLPPYTETSLLDDMIAAGQDARIIKVASGGLDDSFLWENVANLRTKNRLTRAMERFGIVGDGAALGEGGEFETLAIDGPWPLWKNSITVDDDGRGIIAGEAGAASLKITTPRLTPKQESTDFSPENLRKPSLLDDKFDSLMTNLSDMARTGDSPITTTSDANSNAALDTSSAWAVQTVGSCLVISNAMEDGQSAGEEMSNIMTRLVTDFKVNLSQVAFTTILLRDMSEFGAVNLAYGSRFTEPTPPARVTVACGAKLPPGSHVSLSVTIIQQEAATTLKQGLHVQSRSYWAPANIGPYSQAVVVPSLPTGTQHQGMSFVYVAGQIPLNPPTMDFPAREAMSHSEHFQLQSVLALQHLWRIGQIMKITHWLGTVAFIARSPEPPAEARVHTALRTWEIAHKSPSNGGEDEEDEDEDEDVDIWDRVHGRQWSSRQSGSGPANQTKRQDIVSKHTLPCFVAEVETLPRNAPIEWASVGIASYTGDIDVSVSTTDRSTHYTLSATCEGDESVIAGWVAVRETKSLNNLDLPEASEDSFVYTVYTTEVIPESWSSARNSTIVPCYRIWGPDGTSISTAVAFRKQ